MKVPREGATATLLADGKVLVASGNGLISVDPDTGEQTFGDLTSAEVYDPVANTWTLTANDLTIARRLDTATRLADGKVVIVGGIGLGCVDGTGNPLTGPGLTGLDGALQPGGPVGL